MATVYRFPICVWKNADANFTARILDDEYPSGIATGTSAKDAIEQLRDFMLAVNKHQSWYIDEPGFLDPELRVIKFPVLPEYRMRNRTHTCRESIRFRMPCIIGRRATGALSAVLPTLGIYFDYQSGDSFEKLAVHFAQGHLAGLTPRQLSRFLAPRDVGIDQLQITLRDMADADDDSRKLRPLCDVADHLGVREFRRVSRTWEREREVADLSQILAQENASVCLVGDSGCGKTSVLVEASRRVERAIATARRGKRQAVFWQTSGGRLVSGMRYLGQWQERMEVVIQNLASVGGVLCIDNLMELVRLGGEAPESSLAAFLIPYLRHGELRVVVEATPAEFDACDRLLPALMDQFQTMRLEPFSPAASARIVQRAAEFFNQNESTTFGPGAAMRVHELFKQFQPYVAFPGKVIDFMGNTVDSALDAGTDSAVDIARVESEFGKMSGLPDFLIDGSEPLSFAAIVEQFSMRLIGQPKAVECACRFVAKFAAGLNDPARPLGVLLFCGPTGVGKTQLVRLLGDFLFPGRPEKERLIRLDMSEYAGHDAPFRLLGSTAGGGKPSDFIRRVRANPFSIVLLDEIEKASDEVFDVFLNVFEEGRLMDPLGRTTAFNSSLIILTSNLGSGASGSIGFDKSSSSTRARTDPSAVLKFFRPEFFNRLDQVVYFDPLERTSIHEITRKELQDIARREGLSERRLKLTFDEPVVAQLSEQGFDPVYGARPLQRAIERAVAAPLSRLLIESPQLRDRCIRCQLGREGNIGLIVEP
ncbi:MAG: AAA family ATPase [Verrucomicrobiales bacterium]